MIDIIPWAGDHPYIRIEIDGISVFMPAQKRTFWIYFNVQRIPSNKYEDLKEVTPSAKWSFVIDTGVEQLTCTDTLSTDVGAKLDHAMLSYRHKDLTHVTKWNVPISTKDAQELSKELKKACTEYNVKYLVENEMHREFQPFQSVLKSYGDMYKYRFTLGK